MANNRTVRTYKDIDLTFLPHPVTGDVVKRFDENAVKVSIINLITTMKYERPFHPELSSQATDLLFEPMDANLASIISQTVEEVIANHEPRGRVISVVTKPDFDGNGYVVDIQFQVNNMPAPLSIQTFLQRVR